MLASMILLSSMSSAMAFHPVSVTLYKNSVGLGDALEHAPRLIGSYSSCRFRILPRCFIESTSFPIYQHLARMNRLSASLPATH